MGLHCHDSPRCVPVPPSTPWSPRWLHINAISEELWLQAVEARIKSLLSPSIRTLYELILIQLAAQQIFAKIIYKKSMETELCQLNSSGVSSTSESRKHSLSL